MRVLHLLSPRTAGDEGVRACVLSAGTRPGQDVMLIGDGADEARAWRLGHRGTDRVTPGPSPVRAWATARSVARYVRARRGEHGYDLVQCWCLASAGIAGHLGELAGEISVTLVRPSEGDARTPLPSHGVYSVLDRTHQSPVWRLLHARGVHQHMANVRVLDWTVIADQCPGATKAELRAQHGIETGDMVAAYLPAHPDQGDALFFAFMLGLIQVSGRRVVGHMPRGIMHARRAARFVRAHARVWGLAETSMTTPEIVRAADVLIADDCELGVLPGPVLCNWARASGTRIVAASTAQDGVVAADMEDLVRVCPRRSAAIVNAIVHAPTRSPLHAAHASWSVEQGGEQTLTALWDEMLNAPSTRGDGLTPAAVDLGEPAEAAS